MFLVFLGVLILVTVASLMWFTSHAKAHNDEIRKKAQEKNVSEAAALREYGRPELQVPVPAKIAAYAVAALMIAAGLFNKVLFYAEPGYVYHVRTIFGEEKVVDGVADTGYNTYWFGRYNAWKRGLTVQAAIRTDESIEDELASESDNSGVSASLAPLNITFLDQVDANASATARFRIPTDPVMFLKLVHEYRSPENLLRTSLIPTFNETLTSTAQLMGAEEFYSGGRTEFNNEFDNQLRNGIYVVKREERVIEDENLTDATANASIGPDQQKYGDGKKVVFVVKKQLDGVGMPLRKKQIFTEFGIEVVEARITDMRPNQKFVERMQLKQKASADRAIAREQRIQEEEQKLLAEARGAREVAERQAKAKVEQIEKTTNAETEKQLALTESRKLKEQADIAKVTAGIELEKARLEAQTIRTLAEAEAYKKRKLLEADGALTQKLEAIVRISEVQAAALAKRSVPTQLILSGASESGGMGNDSELMSIMQTQLLKNLNSLQLDMKVQK